jgi:hypothetical protein
MENTLFSNAIALQADIDRRAKLASETKQAANDAAFVQMVLFIAGNQSAKIQGGTKKAGQFQSALIEAHNFPKRHAQTVASIALNKKICALVNKGLAGRTIENDANLAQVVTDILADNELTSVNKLKSFIAAPVDRVAKLLEALAKLDEDELESFKDGFSAMIGEEE